MPASICMTCSSVEGACTLSEVQVLGLYQYIFVSSFPKRTMLLMYPLLLSPKRPPKQLRIYGVPRSVPQSVHLADAPTVACLLL